MRAVQQRSGCGTVQRTRSRAACGTGSHVSLSRRPRIVNVTRVASSAAPVPAPVPVPDVKPLDAVPGMEAFLNTLKYNEHGLITVIVQHEDTGEVLMQAYADKPALSETLQTRLATFYSRSRKGRWCKGETSGNYIKVKKVFTDCDRDSIIYMGEPIGPACHTGARTCWFSEVLLNEGSVLHIGGHENDDHIPCTTLLELEQTIGRRRELLETLGEPDKPSWTYKLLQNPALLCKKVREEADELCRTVEDSEGRQRTASEMADLLYHSMVLLGLQDVPMEEVLAELRRRTGTSGLEEKAARPLPVNGSPFASH